MDPALLELMGEGEPEDEVAVILRLRHRDRLPAGVKVVSRFGTVVTCRVTRGAIPAVRRDPATASLKAPMRYTPEVEESGSETAEAEPEAFEGAEVQRWDPRMGATGSRVVLAAVDWGLDVAHPDFRRPDGSTRLTALWDQRSATGPNRYGYGRVIRAEEINAALASPDPYVALGYDPADFDSGSGAHGTHTLSIAGGNGRGGGPVGVAPEAELMFVNMGRQGSSTTPLTDSVELLEALDFIATTAGDRPFVVNMSLGRMAGEHTGHTLVEMAMDQLVSTAPGRAIVQSCGNYYQRRTHSAWLLRPGDVKRLRMRIDRNDRTSNELDIWYSGRDRLRIDVTSVNGGLHASVPLGENARLALDGHELARVYHRRCDPNNGDNQCRIILEPSRRLVDWEVALVAEDVVDGRVHAWIERDSACRGCQSRFAADDVDVRCSTGSICNGYLTLAVGAYDRNHPDRAMGGFSSSGPTRDGRQKPDLVAPGVNEVGARSAPRGAGPGARYIRMSGTSMASPHVAGTVALLFSAARRKLPIQETRALVLASCERPAPGTERRRLGSGYLQPLQALALLERQERTTPLAANRQEAGALLDYEAVDELFDDVDPEAPALDVEGGWLPVEHDPDAIPVDEGESTGEAQVEEEAVPAEDETEVLERDCGEAADADPTVLEVLDRLAALDDPEPASSPLWQARVLQLCGVDPSSQPRKGGVDVFDLFTNPARIGDRSALAPFFTPVGRPSRPMERAVRPGDVVVRRARGSPYSTMSVVARPGLDPTPDGPAIPGYYAVVQGAIHPGPAPERVLVTDAAGVVPAHTLVLRPRVWESLEESVLGPCADVEVAVTGRPKVLRHGSVHPAVRNAQRKLNAFHAYRIAAGLPGLPEAPLKEDCIFLKRTHAAVKEFQRIVFPGQPKEHDAKIGVKTWAHLDAIGIGTGSVALVTVERMVLTDDSFVPLSWDQVIGLDTTTINVEVAVSGLPVAAMPAHVVVVVLSRLANGKAGAGSLVAVPWEVPLSGVDPTKPTRVLYRLSKAMSVAPFLAVERTLKEVATLVRPGGTSAAIFRSALGWSPRGIATVPTSAGGSSGSEAGEVPDGRALMRAGGVEVLELKLSPSPNWTSPAPQSRLIRSPADVLYYSGHGRKTGQLLIDTEAKPCRERGAYVDFLGPADLRAVWRSPMDLDVLILAGCSVLRIDPSSTPMTGPGMDWADLLVRNGGPLAAILGYRDSAPCDDPNGNKIAEEMAKRLARGSGSFAEDWLSINGDNNANNAVALDGRGYWWIEEVLGGLSFTTKCKAWS